MVVAIEDQPDRYVVIDGYKRIAALEQLGRDTVEAVVWAVNEAAARAAGSFTPIIGTNGDGAGSGLAASAG